MRLRWWGRAATLPAAVIAAFVASTTARADVINVLSQISVPGSSGHHTRYGRIYSFPSDVREYSDRTFLGYSFREDYQRGGWRVIDFMRVRTPGAYMMVTDLPPTGRMSHMAHTVVIVFPRVPVRRKNLYDVAEESSGQFRVRAPDGSWLWFDGTTGSVRAASGFVLSPQGGPGTPPGVQHGGLHVVLQAVGKNPFRRGATATIVDARGQTCRVDTDSLFVYPNDRPESDAFRFDTDADFFSYLRGRCPDLATPDLTRASYRPWIPTH
ncbi:MAG: hypothetical protein QOD06_1065, partial [Candidatus Binatota bacterium]|nr:hypothetical protein [Candidatus Binatota bacterium]